VQAAALGLRVKSGWASGVVLTGPLAAPRMVERCVLELSDPAIPELRQPYHAGMGRLEEDARILARRTRAIERTTGRNVRDLLRRVTASEHGVRIRGVGLIVGSLIDPATVGSPHIRAHASEGQLFRTVLERAFQQHDLPCLVLLERRAYAEAAARLGRAEEEIKSVLTALGRERERRPAGQRDGDVDRGWRADHKLAALAAWLLVAASG
jgi:hypothetical protein